MNLPTNKIKNTAKSMNTKQNIWPQIRMKFESMKIALIFGEAADTAFKLDSGRNQLPTK